MNGNVKNPLAITVLFVFAIVLVSCGTAGTKCHFSSLNVSASGPTTADHTAVPPGNKVHFSAFGMSQQSECGSTQANLTNVTWSVSDTANVSISNTQDITFGDATCLKATSGPITVTATLPSDLNNGFAASGTATMTCN